MILSLILPLFNFLSVQAIVLPSVADVSAIYGKDERSFVSKNSTNKISEISKSIALIVSKDIVDKKLFYSNINGLLLSDPNGVNLCPTEKYASHHTVNSCTGFMIGDNLLASAGHCFESINDCDNKLIIFNTRVSSENKSGYRVLNHDVYECEEIVKTVFDPDAFLDFSIIKLKKKVFGIKPLKLRNSGLISTNDQVFMIGHPMGLPLVSTTSSLINDITNPHYFKATLDSFEGNSGSPVINSKTFEVEGILVRGEEDFLQDEKEKCYRYEVYEQGSKAVPSLKGEGVSRINDLLPFIKN